jgi:hypothetical protein
LQNKSCHFCQAASGALREIGEGGAGEPSRGGPAAGDTETAIKGCGELTVELVACRIIVTKEDEKYQIAISDEQ